MIAILSDVHGNIEALQAVLKDIEERKVEKILCLGDLIGYGPDPAACLALAPKFEWTLMGNHEEGCLSEEGRASFTPRARTALEWTRRKLLNGDETKARDNPHLRFLQGLPTTREDGDIVFVHGSPVRPTRDYIFPRDATNRQKLQPVFDRIRRVCFAAHTHLPGVFTENFTFTHPTEFFGVYMLGSGKVLINVGSVGQPRDNDNRACYVTFDGDSVVFRRVEYDYQRTIRKIRAVPDLHPSLADRLAEGV